MTSATDISTDETERARELIDLCFEFMPDFEEATFDPETQLSAEVPENASLSNELALHNALLASAANRLAYCQAFAMTAVAQSNLALMGELTRLRPASAESRVLVQHLKVALKSAVTASICLAALGGFLLARGIGLAS